MNAGAEVRSLFFLAMQQDAGARAQLVRDRASDPGLAREVLSLLEYVEQTTLRRTDGEALATDQDGTAEADIPDSIGEYRVSRLLGSGGMGVVFEAQQETPRRTVAVKALRPEAASPSSIQRLRFEGELLAGLKHPAIATLFASGVWRQNGLERPYFAMEYVEGARAIDAYANERSLEQDDRVALFLHACEGVAHAHQHGVIHRDIKPSNLLVGNDGRLKVIDFGIASATPDLLGSLALTQTGELMGTLGYMAPERVEGTEGAASVAGDVFALGCVLYLLITDRPVYQLAGMTLWEAMRLVRSGRAPSPRTINPGVPGDLDAIVRRCLDADPRARFGSVSELIADLRRFARCEPVSARPPTLAHQARLFYRRHRAASAIAAGMLALLIASSVVSSVLAVRESVARRQATLQSDRLDETMSTLLKDVFASADPRLTGGHTRTIAEAVEAASERISSIEDGFVRAAVQSRLATILASIGSPDSALGHAQSAVRFFDREGGSQDLGELALALRAEAWALSQQGDYQGALRRLERSIDLYERLGPRKAASLAEALGASASLLSVTGRPAEGVERGRLGESLGVTRLGSNDPELVAIRWYLAQAQQGAGDVVGAMETLNRALEGQTGAGTPTDPLVATTLSKISNIAGQLGDPDLASSSAQRALAIRRETLPDGHPSLLQSLTLVAAAAIGRGEYNSAIPLLDQALEGYEAAYGHTHPFVARTLISSSAAHLGAGNASVAAERLPRAIIILQTAESPDAVRLGAALSMLGEALTALDRLDDAELAFDRAEAVFPDQLHPALLERHTRRRTQHAGLVAVRRGRSEVVNN